MKKISFSILLLFSAIVCASAADSDSTWHINGGLYGAFNLNMHSSKFAIAPQQTLFDQNATSLTGAIGLILNYPINSTFTISGRLGYHAMGAKFESKNSADTTLDASLGYIEFTPSVIVRNLFPSVRPLYLLGGLELGFPASNSFKFAPGADSSSVAMKDVKTRIALALGAGYIFKLNKFTYLTPEVSVRIPLAGAMQTGAASATRGYSGNVSSWSATQIRFGVNLTFSLDKDDYAGGESSSGDIKAGFSEIRYYDNDGRHHPLSKINIEDVQYTELFPLVPYVFYDENQDKASDKTQVNYTMHQAGPFSLKKLQPDAIAINKSTLDVIGVRMAQNESAKLTINGTTDGKAEKGDTELARRRAQSAKDYLVKNFEINESRIAVTTSDFPAKPSASTVAEGVEENRRIEFSSDTKEILAPIALEKENQRLAEPNLIEFVPFASSSDSISKWEMQIAQAGEVLKSFKGIGRPSPQQWVIYPNELTNKQLPVEYTLTVHTEGGATETSKGRIPVDYFSISRKKSEELADRSISKYSLILFDFDKSEIPADGLDIIKKHIIPAIKFNSIVKIYGYTDAIGDEKYNQKLAEKRANAVKDVLQASVKSARFEVYGVGANDALFDQKSPIGRQLSRTVQIFVVTPR